MAKSASPLPWSLVENDGGSLKIIDADGEFVSFVSVSRYVDGRKDPTATANAAHIIRAVNAHDRMVAALRDILDACVSEHSDKKKLAAIDRYAATAIQHSGAAHG